MVALYDDQLPSGLELPAMTEDVGRGQGDGGGSGSGLTVESMRMLMVLTVMVAIKIGMMVLLATMKINAGNGDSHGSRVVVMKMIYQ